MRDQRGIAFANVLLALLACVLLAGVSVPFIGRAQKAAKAISLKSELVTVQNALQAKRIAISGA